MSDPIARNRLDSAASPYLRQHADNPVNWQPWDDDALAAARERDRPIFCSIGYSACHWCHVMAEESFQDETVAAALNESFVPIKVDREERPDLDSLYMSVCQLVTGGGGWPLSAFLTPEGEPFYVGTYFPREPPAERNVPGFLELTERIADSWADPEQRAEMEQRASQWTAAVRDRTVAGDGDGGDPPTAAVVDRAVAAATRSADEEFGGFGRGQKFPQPGRLRLLLRAGVRGEDAALNHAAHTFDAMGGGGLYDHVGGGFHRYCTDREWTIPHFEKMLYDNAELSAAFLDAARATGVDEYERVARETFAFLDRELRGADGGFCATLDARSETPASRLGPEESPEREEGAFYVWTPEEVEAALDDEAAALVRERYGIVDGGNFEGGTTVPTLRASIEDLAADRGADETAVRERLNDARERLRHAREERPRPDRDGKRIAGWNGLAVSALAEGSLVLDPDLGEQATETLGFVRERLWDADADRLARHAEGDRTVGEGYLEDYAYLARGALDCYGATASVEPLSFALDLGQAIVDAFYDESAGTLYYTPDDGEELAARPQELSDRSTPSPVGVAVDVLLRLRHFAPDAGFGPVADDVLASVRDRVRSDPLQHVSLVEAAARRDRGGLELALAADSYPPAWRETLGSRFLPDAVLAPRPSTDAGLSEWLEALGLEAAPPIWANRSARDGEPTAYACRNRACSPPTTDLAEAIDWAADNAAPE